MKRDKRKTEDVKIELMKKKPKKEKAQQVREMTSLGDVPEESEFNEPQEQESWCRDYLHTPNLGVTSANCSVDGCSCVFCGLSGCGTVPACDYKDQVNDEKVIQVGQRCPCHPLVVGDDMTVLHVL